MPNTVLSATLFAVSAPVLFLLWVIFVGTFAAPEMLVGAAAAVVAALALCVVERAEPAHFRPALTDAAQLAHVPWLVVEDTYVILYAALRDLVGGRKAESAFRVVRFHGGDSRNPADTARRVLATAGNTIAPNSIILGINSPTSELLLHQIEKSSVPQMTKNLGANP